MNSFYNDDEVSGVNVSVSVKNATVREILERRSEGNVIGLSYRG